MKPAQLSGSVINAEEGDERPPRSITPLLVGFAALVALARGAALHAASGPEPGSGFGILGGGLFVLYIIALAVLGVALAIVAGAAIVEGRLPRGSTRWWSWALTPPLILLTVLALSTDAPLKARFALSRDSLEAIALDARRHPAAARFTGSWVTQSAGLYTVYTVDEVNGVVHLATGFSGFLDDRPHGFAFSPDGIPGTDGSLYEELSGDWYLWRADPEYFGYPD